jgi:tetratricopeptide (TPR) repeat protein
MDQSGQTVHGPQTNIHEAHGPVFSGHFVFQGDFIYNEATKVRLPFQRPPRVPHFTGREAELAALLRDLQPSRTVTICGPGGMGKTALAAEAIWQLAPGSDPPQRFPDGIIFHTFYHKPQAALALEAIARAYGQDPRQSPLDAAKSALSGRIPLIVLDGAEACDDLQMVLSVIGGCGVLITTRRHSDAPEDFSDLPPLPEDKAIELLQAWGGSMASDERICRSICALLGRLPLAIFLAGRYLSHRRQIASDYLAWLEKTPLEALDLGKRQHQSIPLLMEHSLKQVSHQASSCLGLAGILAMKPFPPEVIAEALQISSRQANISLGELVNYGLLIRPDLCYEITHALAHTYSRERLNVPKDALARLAGHYDKLSREQVALGLAGYARLDAQRDHILEIQSACNKAELWNEVRSLTWALEDYLDLRGHWQERIVLLQAGLNAARSDKSQDDERAFLNSLGVSHGEQGEFRKAIDYFKQSLTMSREAGDQVGEANNLSNIGIIHRTLGENRKAIEYHQQALFLARGTLNRSSEGRAFGGLGLAYLELRNFPKAIEYLKQYLMISQDIRERGDEAKALGNLGVAYYQSGKIREAIDYFKQSLAVNRMIGNLRGEGADLFNLGLAYADLGEIEMAIDYAKSAQIIFQQIESPHAESVRKWLKDWQGDDKPK